VEVRAYSADVGDITIGGTAAGAGNLIIGVIEVNASAGHTVGSMTIQGNKIGTDVTGTVAPYMGGGVYLQAGSGSIAPSLIGGNTAGARNLISPGTTASGAGIYASGVSALTIQGNYIGCNAAGTATIGSGDWAVRVDGGSSFSGTVQIGGSGPGEGNLLTGGALGGVRVGWTTATIEGNFIGVGLDGKTPLSNTVGILVDSADASIGGTAAGQRNVIAKNYSDGVQVDISMPAIRNAAKATVLGNSIFGNGRLGIYFVGTGQVPLPNDPGDGDTGPNGLQNYPVMTSAAIQGGQVFLSGTLDSMPNTLYRIEWFANTACDPSGYGEGRLPLGGSSYMTDAFGHAAFTGVMRPIPVGYPIITATATDPAGNTSEFSTCFTATGPNSSFYSLLPCRLSDTRNANGPYGGPSLVATEQRSYVVAGQCGVPANAVSVALNVAVTAPSGIGNLVLFPAEAALPTTSTVNYGVGRTRSNNAIVPLGPNGDLTVFANQAVGKVDVIIDVTGYFQ
jgi:trimeric autotransporter adhesin